MSFLSSFGVDKLFKALTAPFFSSSPVAAEQADSTNNNNNNNNSSSSDSNSVEKSAFQAENKMPGIVGENDIIVDNKKHEQQLVDVVNNFHNNNNHEEEGEDGDMDDDDMVEEAEIWQNELYDNDLLPPYEENIPQNSVDQEIIDLKRVVSNDSDIFKCASDVLNGIIENLADLDGINDNNLLLVDKVEDGSSEFLDALDVDDSVVKFNLPVFASGDGPERDLLEFSKNNSQLLDNNKSLSEETLSAKNYDDYHSSTPLNDSNCDSNTNDFLNDNSSDLIQLKQHSALEEGGEISADSFQTAVSTMSTEERPITSKGQYSLDFEQLLAAGDAAAAMETIDPFGGRSSTKNKTFTRKSTTTPTKKPQEQEENLTVDTNANDVEKTPKVQPTNEEQETKKITETVSPVVKTATAEKQEKPPVEDIKNSNVVVNNVAVQPSGVVENGVKSKETTKIGSTDETPKKPPKVVENVRRDVSAKVPAGRVPGAQQTAIVAPMINTNVEQQSSGECTAAKVKPTPAPTKHQQDSDEEFVMASSDLFADPSALDYLQKHGGTGNAVDSELYRQSLYVKFDPLVAERAAAGSTENPPPPTTANAPKVAAAPVKKVVKQQQPQSVTTPVSAAMNCLDETLSANEMASADKNRKLQQQEKDDLLLMKTPSPKPTSSSNDTTPPSCPPTVVLKKKAVAQARPNAASASSNVNGEVDNILSVESSSGGGQPDASASMQQIQQMKMQFQAYVMAKEKEWLTKFREEREKNERLTREVATLNERSSTFERNANEMKLVVAEYDKTIRDLMKQLEKSKGHKHDDYDKILKDKEQALEDLQSVENAFSELHRRYEKLRSSTEEFKKNEEKLRESVADLQNKLKISEEKFRKLKDHAEEKLESANTEIDRLQKAKESDTVALKAAVKKRDLQVESLEKALEQKQKEIQELSAICDELIQKVDHPQNVAKNGV